MTDKFDVLIAGAGLAGLACARRLQQSGLTCQMVEATDWVGGRVRTDRHEGFLLDRGFQVLLTAYPEAKRVLSFRELELRRFRPGALVWYDRRFHRVADPWRDLSAGVATVFSPIGTLADKVHIARLRARVCRGHIDALFQRPETTTLELLRTEGFSDNIIDRFFRPLFGGVLLDRELSASSRMFEFVFRMFAQGDTVLPANGMGAIPRLLYESLRGGSLRADTRAEAVTAGSMTLAGGHCLNARAVVVATDGPEAARLTGGEAPAPGSRGVWGLYFAAPRSPIEQPWLVLNGEGRGPINNLCVPSVAAPRYAPEGQALISVSVLEWSGAEAELVSAVRGQLVDWFGPEAGEYRHLRTYYIAHAQPEQRRLPGPGQGARLPSGVFVCGDHRESASIEGALHNGRVAADAVVAELARAAA